MKAAAVVLSCLGLLASPSAFAQTYPSKPVTPEEFAKYVGDQLALWTRLIKQAGIQPE